MSNLQMWSLVVGFLLPPALAIVQQPKWPTWARSVVTFAACLLAAVGTTYLTGPEVFTGRRWIEAALTTFVAAIATYESAWKKTGVAPAIEKATTL